MTDTFGVGSDSATIQAMLDWGEFNGWVVHI